MKRILFFLVVLLPFLAKSQTIITGKYKYTDSLTFAKYKNNSTLDSVLSVDQNGRLRLSSKSPLDTTSLSNRIDARVKYTDTANMLIPYLRKLDTTGKWLSVGYLPYLVKYSDTAAFLSAYYNKTAIDARLALKLNISDTANMLSPYVRTSNLPSLAPYVKYTDTASMLSPYYRTANATAALALKLNISDTANMLSSYYNKMATDSKLALKLNISDTANMLSPYARTLALGGYVPYSGATKDVNIGTKNYYGNAFFDGFTSVAASGTLITLTVSSTPSYLITGSGGQTIKLPDATTLPNGAIYVFNNNQSSGAISVNNNSNTLVKSVPSGGYLNLELIDNSTAAGSWDAHFQAPSNVSWSTNTFDYPGSITSATWNGNTIAINRGGTGASTSGGALTNLGAQPQLNGTGFVKASGTTISYDNSTYLTSADIAGKVNYTDTATMLSPYSRDYNTVHKAGTETIMGDKTFNGNNGYGGINTFNTYQTRFEAGIALNNTTSGGAVGSHTVIGANTDGLQINLAGGGYNNLKFASTSTGNSYTFPNATGTLALTSDIPSITGKLNISDTAAMLSGYKTYYPRAALSFTAGSGAYNNSTGVITIPTNTNQLTNGAGFISSYTETDPVVKAINGIVKSNGTTISAATAGTDYVSPSGLTTALSSYLPLAGGNVTGDLILSSGSLSTLKFLTSGADRLYIAATGTQAVFNSLTTNPIRFQIGGTTYLNIASSGNVQVNGYTDNGYTFDVNGTGRFTGSLYGGGSAAFGTTTIRSVGGYNFLSINGTTKGGYLDLYYNNVLTGAIGAETNLSIAALNANGIDFITSSSSYSTKLNIANSGAATFSSSVTVNGDNSIFNGGTANNFNTYALGIANTKYLVFASTAAAQADGRNWSGGIGADASENVFLGSYNNLTFGAGTLATRMTILGSNGNVGIGTSNPTQALTVNGNAAVGGQQAFWLRDDDGFSSSSSRRAWAITANYETFGMLSFYGASAANSNPLSGTAFLNITSGGNVLIGTTTDAGYLLNVNGTARFNQSTFNVSSGTNQLILQTTGTNRAYIEATSSSLFLNSLTGNDIQFQVDGTTKMTMSAGGNLNVAGTFQNGSGPTMKFLQKFAGVPATTGNVLSVSIDGTTYYIQLYTTTL